MTARLRGDVLGEPIDQFVVLAQIVHLRAADTDLGVRGDEFLPYGLGQDVGNYPLGCQLLGPLRQPAGRDVVPTEDE
ncbi:hypothetical protein [Streptomyces bobili]|uniref:hypothetical protein n=1 Tax=Streptomyces bobili TaxID=67280 RepID=UPI003F4DF941